MNHRLRIQPYISADLRHRLAAYSAAQDVTESAIAEAALTKYLEPDRTDEALVLRRLDSVVHALGRVEERLEVVGEAIARFVRFSFKVAPAKIAADAPTRAEGLYQGFSHHGGECGWDRDHIRGCGAPGAAGVHSSCGRFGREGWAVGMGAS